MRLNTLASILDHDGPFASALFDVSRTTEHARQQLVLRCRAARDGLRAAGAPASVATALAERLLEPTGVAGETGRFMIATPDGLLVDETLPQWSGREVLTWGPLPDVTTWLAYLDTTAPVVVVMADKTGADLHHYQAWGREPDSSTTVTGEQQHLSKVPDGGIARSDLQSRTEEVWRGNAREVAAEIERFSGTERPLVVLAGDARARHEIRAAVSPSVARRLVEAEHGSRAEGSSAESLHADVDAAVHGAVIDRQLNAMRRLEERVGRHRSVALGVRQVLDAAVMGNVETVVIDGARASGTTARPGDHPSLSLPSAARDAVELRADLLVLAAAATTSADAVFAGPTMLPDDGVAAMLRWNPAPGVG